MGSKGNTSVKTEKYGTKVAISPPELLEIVERMHIEEERRNNTPHFELSQLTERCLKEDINSHYDLQPPTSLCLQRSKLPDLVFAFKGHLPSFMVVRKLRK